MRSTPASGPWTYTMTRDAGFVSTRSAPPTSYQRSSRAMTWPPLIHWLSTAKAMLMVCGAGAPPTRTQAETWYVA